jgi:hypothetical protein
MHMQQVLFLALSEHPDGMAPAGGTLMLAGNNCTHHFSFYHLFTLHCTHVDILIPRRADAYGRDCMPSHTTRIDPLGLHWSTRCPACAPALHLPCMWTSAGQRSVPYTSAPAIMSSTCTCPEETRHMWCTMLLWPWWPPVAGWPLQHTGPDSRSGGELHLQAVCSAAGTTSRMQLVVTSAA